MRPIDWILADPHCKRSSSNTRARSGGNSRAFNDPLVLEQAFPGLRAAPGGSVIAVADNLLDLTGSAHRLTSDLSLRYSQKLIAQIQSVDPNYRSESLGFPSTVVGQAAQINDLKLDRAVALYRKRGELRPRQVEVFAPRSGAQTSLTPRLRPEQSSVDCH